MESSSHKLSTIAVTLLILVIISIIQQLGSGETVMQLRSDEKSNPVASERVLMTAGGTGHGGLGPYSTPPSCNLKCAGCKPCMTVPVAVSSPDHMPCKHHRSQYMDHIPYLPVVWCCQCGGKLYPPSP